MRALEARTTTIAKEMSSNESEEKEESEEKRDLAMVGQTKLKVNLAARMLQAVPLTN